MILLCKGAGIPSTVLLVFAIIRCFESTLRIPFTSGVECFWWVDISNLSFMRGVFLWHFSGVKVKEICY